MRSYESFQDCFGALDAKRTATERVVTEPAAIGELPCQI